MPNLDLKKEISRSRGPDVITVGDKFANLMPAICNKYLCFLWKGWG